ncbi:potassium channel family protein [Christiangramia sabulilitoris]|uniref:Two pore domain potassium channel family protein n=1 Tax=Christiangramia sabulilitoris TaxID=2583991 RepID=A0A550I7V4_9FLAO|nr:potassium channel family protein [Christiangramia sabulilitoris]TRO67055.1 two pore domain potassium channel family protein [Christiangramia sabulilitoris]
MLFLLIAGILLYLATVLDVIQTTLSMQGGGWLTSRFSHNFWKFLLVISGRNGKSKILAHAGYILLLIIALIWVLFLWLSLTLILYSYNGAIIDATTKIPANFWQIVYYSGYSISTLGMGDYVPSADIWRIVTSIYSFTGLILLTMSVTYFIPVLSAVIEQRKLGIKMSTLGSSPEVIVLSSWNGKNFQPLIRKIDSLSDAIIKYSQQHRAYPVIHYFHNNKEKNAIVLQLARLYEALLIITERVKKEYQPDPEDLKPLFVAFENYFEVISEVTHITPVKSMPPVSTISKLEQQDLVLKPDGKDSFEGTYDTYRKFFKTLVIQDGWSWDQVDVKSS